MDLETFVYNSYFNIEYALDLLKTRVESHQFRRHTVNLFYAVYLIKFCNKIIDLDPYYASISNFLDKYYPEQKNKVMEVIDFYSYFYEDCDFIFKLEDRNCIELAVFPFENSGQYQYKFTVLYPMHKVLYNSIDLDNKPKSNEKIFFHSSFSLATSNASSFFFHLVKTSPIYVLFNLLICKPSCIMFSNLNSNRVINIDILKNNSVPKLFVTAFNAAMNFDKIKQIQNIVTFHKNEKNWNERQLCENYFKVISSKTYRDTEKIFVVATGLESMIKYHCKTKFGIFPKWREYEKFSDRDISVKFAWTKKGSSQTFYYSN